jgi:NAD(P)H-dependent FMN reductase
MHNILILSASVRTGRKSHRVAQYFRDFIEMNSVGVPSILDLDAYQFPIFHERLRYQEKPADDVLEFAAKFKSADGLLIVTPEYNGGYPASLKNAIDLFTVEWYHKPVAIATVSSGMFGGSQVITSLQFTLWKLHALVAPAIFPVPKVDEAFDENGKPADKEASDKRASKFLEELTWMMDANAKMTNP